MKFGSLFSGIGGFDLALENAGMSCAWQVEIDKHCQQILRKHFMEAKLYEDVKTITKENVEPVELICGGFPCQDLSVAGKRAGLAGDRSGLWFEFIRIIDEVRPRWVIIENVPGLLSSNKGQDFALILQGLEEFGYGVAWRILDAQYFGVAQRRRRVFIVASLGSGRCAEILFEREGMSRDTTPRRETGQANTRTFTIRSGTQGNGGRGNLDLLEGAMTLGGQPQWVSYENHPADSRITETGEISQQLTSRMGTGGGNVPLVQRVVGALQERDGKGIGTTIDDKAIPTAQGVRRLTPTECDRLQGFPDGWTFHSDSTRYKQLGNAVAVPVVEWIGKRIMSLEKSLEIKTEM